MHDGGGFDAGVAKIPSQQLVAEWIIGACKILAKRWAGMLGRKRD